ncbi:polyhydroxyalkanoate synthesis repressor PhaR [Pseudoxanthobacter sp. M-2]|uniref:polyhydroxyalkanoate synthesis repressor PhaR n=1 Tax=Pseudoxanthobacter sp. M-2 TaxID=3078754 RepID=UPI0038FC40AC
MARPVTKSDQPTIIKKYANRRLYNTGTSTYVTLEDLASMVKSEEDFIVYDAKSGEDITRPVLTQIIFEQEGKGHNLLPTTFLRQLIRFYGDSLQNMVPSYLEYMMSSLTRDQDQYRSQIAKAFGTNPFGTSAFGMMEDQVRRNTEIFDRAMRMFLPFGATGGAGGEAERGGGGGEARPAPGATDLDDLKRQLSDMQRRLDTIAGDKK